jgi:hypothetical protein
MTQKSTAAGRTTPAVAMTAAQRAGFDRDGYLIIRAALRPDEAAGAREAIDRVYTAGAKAGSLGPERFTILSPSGAGRPNRGYPAGLPLTGGSGSRLAARSRPSSAR